MSPVRLTHKLRGSAAQPLTSQAMRWAVAIGAGVATTVSYVSHFVPQNVSLFERLGIACYLVVVFTALVYVLLFRWTLPLLRPLTQRQRRTWGAVALVIGALLVAIIPIRPPPLPTTHHLTIVATGQKQPEALSSQVWVLGLYRGDGTQVPLSEFALEGQWEIRNGRPLSYQQQPATLRWQGTLDSDAQLRLVSHQWSGIAQITWDGTEQRVDLYNQQTLPKVISLSAQAGAERGTVARMRSVLIAGTDAISIGLLILLISVGLARWPLKEEAAQNHVAGHAAYDSPKQ